MRRAMLVFVLSSLSALQAATQRCDLVSQPGPSKCLDLSQLDKSTIRVPANTTRIPSGGLTVCGVPGSVVAPTDIVYIVDQTASMKPTVIKANAGDTTGWYECGKTVKTIPGIILFHGDSVSVADSTQTHDSLLAHCKVAGDPYSVRSSTIQSAIQTQANLAPISSAATIQFGPTIWGTPTPMTSLANQIGIDSLLNSLPLGALSGTNFEAPLEWARILLYGGQSTTGKISASPDHNKAIVIISDGVPNTSSVWQNALKAVDTITQGGAKWTGDSASIPPVYSIYLGIDTVAGSVLRKISDSTGGTYHQIPPNRPDSLAAVVKKIMGTLIKIAKPDTFRVTNLTNGQSSVSTASVSDGNSYQMQLDSLVALNPGPNNLALSLVEGGKTIKSTWTILVSDTGAPSIGALDTLLKERCGVPSSLVLQPDHSGLPYAIDSVDRNLLLTLRALPDSNKILPLLLTTRISSDREGLSLAVPPGTAKDSLATFPGSIPWQAVASTGSVPGDLVIRSGPGWDTAYARFQMPRDPRDTASAVLALRRWVAPSLSMTPSVEGPTGQSQVTVVDSNISAKAIYVTVRHRLGDTLSVRLDSVALGIYRGSFAFAQGVPVNLGDTILELAPLGTARDSMSGSYLSLSAQTLVLPPTFHLRFLDSLGNAHDSLGFVLALGQQVPVTLQAWFGASPCTACNEPMSIRPSDSGLQILSTGGTPIGSILLQSGKATVDVKGLSPLHAGSILFSVDSLVASVVAQPIRVLSMPTLSMTPSVEGPTGQSLVTVVDSSLVAKTIYVTVRHRLGDTLTVRLDSIALGIYQGSFAFAQGVPVNRGDTILELAPLGTARDSMSGSYLSLSAQTLVLPPTFHLRFLDSLGNAHDSLGFVLALGQQVPVTLQAWFGASPCTACNEPMSIRPSDSGLQILSTGGTPIGSILLQSGKATVDVKGLSPLHAGSILFSVDSLVASVVAQPIRVLPLMPDSVVYLDADGDGALDRAVLYLRAPWRSIDEVQFPWADSTSFLPWKTASLELSKDSLVASFGFPPQSPGVTQALTSLLAHWRFDTSWSWQPVPVVEHIAPVPVTAHYLFSATGRTPDTLVVTFSESMRVLNQGSWVSLGHPGSDSLGTPLKPVFMGWLSDGSEVAWFLLDSASGIQPGDSLRITAAPTGALSDSSGNAPNQVAKWIQIEWGVPPPVMALQVPHAVVKAGSVPMGEPPVTLLVNDIVRGTWKAPDGPAPQDLETRFGGVVVRLNRIPQSLGMYVYDNLGVLVLSVEIPNIAELAASGVLKRDLRGDYVVWLAWNGKDASGRDASTGIYTIRVHGWVIENGHRYLVNQLKSHGFNRKVPN